MPSSKYYYELENRGQVANWGKDYRPLNATNGALGPPPVPARETEGLLYKLYLLKAPPRTTPIAAPTAMPT